MKGEKDKLNRGEKLFNKIVFSTNFQKTIKEIRCDFDIPQNGFLDMNEVSEWYGHMYSKFNKIRSKFLLAISTFLRIQMLPDNEWWNKKLFEYIVNNERFLFLPRTAFPIHPFIEIVGRNSGKEGWLGGFYTDLRIYEGASQRDITDYVKKHYIAVKPTTRVGATKKIQPERTPGLNKKIMEQMEKPLKKLQDETKTSHSRKEIIVSTTLSKEFNGKKIYSDGVAMRAYRKRNAKR